MGFSNRDQLLATVMAPIESRREPGTVDPTATESSQMTSEKPTPTKSSEPDSSTRVDNPKKTINRAHRKKHPVKGKTSKPSRLEVESDSESSSGGDSDDEDSDSVSEVKVKKSKRLSRAVLRRRRSKEDSKKTRKAEEPLSSEPDSAVSDSSETDEDNVSENDINSDVENGKKGRQGKQGLDLQQLQQLSQLMLQNQQRALVPNPAGFPSGSGMALNPDPAQIQAAMQSPFLQQLFNAQLGKVLQNSGGEAGQSGKQRRGRQQKRKSGTRNAGGSRKTRSTDKNGEKSPGGDLEYKRVDQVWDSSIHNYKLKDTTGSPEIAQYEGFLFHIRRTFDWEGKYKTTYVDVKSKDLRECLREVIGNIKGVSLVEETPKLDPNLLFL